MNPAAPPVTHHAADERPGGSALLVIDMISAWDFPDAPALARQAQAIAAPIARLRQRCKRAGVPVIYANDNRGRWRSDLRRQIDQSIAAGDPGARITEALMPGEDDYFVLKPRHSAFFATPLELLLQDLGPRRLILAGVSSDQCVLASAADAHMRGYQVVVPRDCVASLSPRRNRASIVYFEQVLKVATPSSSRLRLS